MKLLLVKTSSMGDVIHALPVVSDLRAHRPDIVIDWAVEEAFADLPALHPGVRRVQPVALRRWRRAPGRPSTWRELAAARRALRAARYDAVLDLQGLLKSAWVARWANAPIIGFDRTCAREPLAAAFYSLAVRIPAPQQVGATRQQAGATPWHAIERLRALAGQALRYAPERLPSFGLRHDLPRPAWMPARACVAMLHGTSRPEKDWPDADWLALARDCAAAGCEPLWPWGSDAERQRSQRLAAAAGGTVPPRLALAEAAAMLRHAAGAVGVDTGLMHLSAALERPTVAVFTATSPARFGPYWTERARSLGGEGAPPSARAVIAALAELGGLDPGGFEPGSHDADGRDAGGFTSGPPGQMPGAGEAHAAVRT